MTRQSLQFGDAHQLISVLSRAQDAEVLAVWRHTLYLPLAQAFLQLGIVSSPQVAAATVSAMGGGCTVASSYLLSRRAFPRLASVLSALLVASAQATWFFSTAVEVHALYSGVVAISVLLLSSGNTRLYWLMPCACLAYLAHESAPLLIPGFVLVATSVPAWPSPSSLHTYTRLPVAFVIAALGAGVGALLGGLLKSIGLGAGKLSSVGLITSHYAGRPDFGLLWHGVAYPLLGLVVVAAFGFRRSDLASVLGFLVPHVLFVLFVFGDPNGGGYMLPVACVLAPLAARAISRNRSFLVLAIVAIGVQGSLGAKLVLGEGQQVVQRRVEMRSAAASEFMKDGGLLISAELSLQTVTGAVPDLRELNLWREVARANEEGLAPAVFAEMLAPRVDPVLGTSVVAVDLSYRDQCSTVPMVCQYMDALVAELQGRHGGTSVALNGVQFFILGE